MINPSTKAMTGVLLIERSYVRFASL
jgi:hypothetical protein